MSLEPFIESVVNHLLKITPEGMVLYVCGAITFTWVQVAYRQEVQRGLKGDNGFWEAPEWIVYLFSWMFPHMVMADQFLGLKASSEAWWFMGVLLLFGLTGRFGLQWLLAIKNGSNKVEEDKTPKE